MMNRSKLASICFAVALAIGLGAAGSSAKAGGYGYSAHSYQSAGYGHHNHQQYVTVTVWVKKQIPYTKVVTLYKPCGTPYYAKKTYYKTVKVPVQKRIAI